MGVPWGRGRRPHLAMLIKDKARRTALVRHKRARVGQGGAGDTKTAQNNLSLASWPRLASLKKKKGGAIAPQQKGSLGPRAPKSHSESQENLSPGETREAQASPGELREVQEGP